MLRGKAELSSQRVSPEGFCDGQRAEPSRLKQLLQQAQGLPETEVDVRHLDRSVGSAQGQLNIILRVS